MNRILIICLVCVSIFAGTASYPESSADRKQKIADELGRIAAMGGDHAGYSVEILGFLSKKYGIEPSYGRVYLRGYPGDRDRDDDEVDFYSLLSGGLAIRESLQLDTIRSADDSCRDTDIRILTPPQIDSHPYNEMIKGKEPVLFKLDSFIPQEFYSVHFSDTTRALDFFDYLNEVGGGLHSRFTMTPVEFDIKNKIMTQLALKENKEARAFYSKVIEEMTITGSDPFVIEGTDVSLVLKIKIPVMFNSTIARYRKEFRKKFKAEMKTINVAGVSAEFLTAGYRKVNSILVRLPGDIVVISNSVKAAERVILTYKKKHTSLADAPDYRYMRTIYRGERKSEDGFIYLSEAFIRHLVSPELRIKEARRMAAAVKLATLEKFIIYYYQLKGKFPEGIKDVLAAMDEKPLVQEGRKKTVMNYAGLFSRLDIAGNSFSAIHEQYGRIGYMVPNIEAEAGMVSGHEAESYNVFSKEYSDYWKEYFDPIGVRFRFAEGGIEMDTCILPLIENSMYNSLREMFGGGPGNLQTGYTVKSDILSMTFKVDFMKILASGGMLDDMYEESKIPALDKIFGNEIQVHMGDVAPLIDIDGSMLMREFYRGGWSDREMIAGFLVWSFFHPMRIAVPVKKPEEAVKFLDMMLWRERSRHGIDFGITKYGTEYHGTRVNVIKINYFGIASSRLYYSIKDGMLHFTTTEEYIKELIDSGKVSEENVTKNIAVVFRPANMVREKGSYTSGIIEAALETSGRNNGTIKLLHTLFPDAGFNELPDIALKNFGFRPVCPMGGEYSINSKGYVVNSVYGSSYSPYVKETDDNAGTSAVMKRFFSTKEIRLEFEFTPEGIKTFVKTR